MDQLFNMIKKTNPKTIKLQGPIYTLARYGYDKIKLLEEIQWFEKHLIVIKTEFDVIFGGYSPCHQLNENNLNKDSVAGGVIFQSVGD